MGIALDASDLLLALDVVREIGGAADLDDYAKRVMVQIRRAVPCDVIAYNEIDPRVPRMSALIDPVERAVRPDQTATWERWSHQHPVYRHLLNTGDGSAHRLSDFIDRRTFQSLELYGELYRDIGVEFQMSCSLPAPAPLAVVVALSDANRDFSDRDRALLNLLRPHLVQIYWHVLTINQLTKALAELDSGLSMTGWGIARVHTGRLEAMTESSRAWLETFGSNDAIQRWLQSQRDRLGRNQRVPRLAAPLVLRQGGRRLVLRLLPAVDGPDLVALDERADDHDHSVLHALGLTDREAEVLALVMRGHPNVEIARTLGIGGSGVKRHLETIYVKLGVSNRTSAAARAIEAVTMAVPLASS